MLFQERVKGDFGLLSLWLMGWNAKLPHIINAGEFFKVGGVLFGADY